MKININYGNKVAVLPGDALKYFDYASKADLKVLMFLANEQKADVEKIAKALAMRVQEVENSMDFWEEKGIISVVKSKTAKKANDIDKEAKAKAPKAKSNEKAENEEKESSQKPKVVVLRSDEIPNYSSDELFSLLEKRRGAAELIDECQNVIGKIFNVHEIERVLGLIDIYGLDEKYIVAIMKYCAKLNKKSIHYIEKTVISMMDQGIDTEDALKEKIEQLDEYMSVEGSIRKLFGLKARALIAKEKKSIENWIFKYKYDIEIINKAYEKTISATKEPSIFYANAILERWYAEGARTLEDIEKLEEERAKETQNGKETQSGGSFDTDDFFAAALKKSSANN